MGDMPSLNMLVQRLKVAILPLDLTLLWARNPFRGNFNHWQVSRKEAGQIFFRQPKMNLGKEKPAFFNDEFHSYLC